jgi:hypothetical protein
VNSVEHREIEEIREHDSINREIKQEKSNQDERSSGTNKRSSLASLVSL